MLQGKFGRSDIESPKQIEKKLLEGLADIKGNRGLIFTHSGVFQVLLHHLHICDLFVQNCGSLSLVLSETGKPKHITAYWNHGY